MGLRPTADVAWIPTVDFVFKVLVDDTERKGLVDLDAPVHEHLQFSFFGEVNSGIDDHFSVLFSVVRLLESRMVFLLFHVHRVIQKSTGKFAFLAKPSFDVRPF